MNAGWRGRFAIEKSPMAFETLRHNLVDPYDGPHFDWPTWLPKAPIGIESFIAQHDRDVRQLVGLPLLAGGPPCQGFSGAGRRRRDDVRNQLVERYLELVARITPKMLLLENVYGFATPFRKTQKGGAGEAIEADQFNADVALQQRLDGLGYEPFARYPVRATAFGVPQRRPRYILIAIRRDFLATVPGLNPFAILDNMRHIFLTERGLPTTREVTLREAIADLELAHGAVPCTEARMQRFRQGCYGPADGPYQRLLRRRRDGRAIEEGTVADSHRFANHTPIVTERFARILREFRPGIQLSVEERKLLGVRKHRIAPLAAEQPCHTLTSLPDDLIHYLEARVPTVREYARIQSFPDWFEFRSKYTTGGNRRATEVPRYTQVANAVPPLLAESLGLALMEVYDILSGAREPRPAMAYTPATRSTRTRQAVLFD